ncbi:MAG: ribonuclease P protein component [Alphaproteobacteria bacterium]|nr:ribonuclease P protein component [Alphaproteobacteria bacterium]
MSPAVLRLKRRPEFLRVAATRRRWVAPGLIVQARWRRAEEKIGFDGPLVRVGFTVSRKVGSAVARNRARRRLKAAANLVFPTHARAGCDLVVIGRAATLARPFDALIADLKTALKRLDAYEPEPDAR